MKINALSTGSCGNCFLIDFSNLKDIENIENKEKNNNFKRTYIMIDCGFSYKQLTQMLAKENISFEQITHLIVTHEHSDHIKGLQQILKRHPNITLILSPGTNTSLKLDFENTQFISSNQKIIINTIEIIGIEKNHDGLEPLSYVIYDTISKKRIGLFNDLGDYSILHSNILKQCDIIFLECNYDDSLIKTSQMHYSYLQRLQSPLGHLSNEQAAELCSSFIKNNQVIVLSHISENVNSYSLAYEKINQVIKFSNSQNIKLITSFQMQPTGWIQ